MQRKAKDPKNTHIAFIATQSLSIILMIVLFWHFVHIGWKYVEILKDTYEINVLRAKFLMLLVAFLVVAERVCNIGVYSVKRLCLDWKMPEPIWINPLWYFS